ncbi:MULTISPECIES: cell division protein FtsA [Thermoactinomyces]|uniref:cell division protein FtsA n=1 Tax=Thermoactinomyces TaxID=2023 RepID=UPI0005010AE7|nr:MULTISPECIES: cell division protein FtsA [Thermoactinomyces]KFZ40642.1 cell division protein FtsA [Thermoactinomyces sp. Gus2-1]KYQ86960.1 cell division protein FtsA [Thermoactinomyces sp. AS95]MBH8582817.1 cell division protein FtsA [Thermoactinomyces sp. CICC 10735]MBH8585608.1 cell division protein FtsA [Thermoactinomyces sp. CICC 10520]MBI0386895.1 cell division protein FtsA [Thermoactinomyces sp. CICC 24227]
MSNEDFVITLDIGSSQVRVIVAEINADGTPHIVGVGTAESQGMKKGAIINIDQAVQSIREAVDHAERMVGIEISEVFVGVSGHHVSLQPSHGVVAVSSEDREISLHDIDRVLQAARVIALPPERAVIEVVPKQFIVDGLDDIKDPNGMVGVRLEVDAIIVTGTKTILTNLLRCVERADLNIAGMVFLPLAVSELCLSDDEKNLGVVMVDMGGGTTTLTVYQHGHLAGTSVIPIGGEYITNDIAIGLRTQTSSAEEVKCKYGVACKEFALTDKMFNVQTIGTSRDRIVTQLELAQIIEPRLEEMFQLIRQQVKAMGFSEEPAGGYVLTGGVMATQHILHVAQNQLGGAVRIATPQNIGVKEPSYTGGVGMIHYLHKRGAFQTESHRTSHHPPRQKKQRGPSAFEKMKNWLNEFI